MTSDRFHQLGRACTWVGFVLAPIAFSLAMLDYGAHNGGPGIGLEGAGRPGSASVPLLMIAMVGVVGGCVARFLMPPPRVSLWRAAGIGALCFVASMLASRPLFHWKWGVDCGRDVALGCWALAQIAPSGDASASTLARKACSLGESRACKHLTEGSPEEKKEACATRDKACASVQAQPAAPIAPSNRTASWTDATCKDLDGACGAL